MAKSPDPHQRIVVITQFYPPEPAAASNRVSAIARALAAAGHEVTVITGQPSFPDGVVPAEYKRREGREAYDGLVRIRRVWTYASPRLRAADRVLNWLSVAVGATLYLLRRREALDIVFVSSPPITLALPALVGAAWHRARLVVDVRDIYPEVAVKLDIWKKDSLLVRIVTRVAELIYRRAQLILTVTDTCRSEIVAHGVPPEKVVIAPNGFDAVDVATDSPVRRTNGEFVIGYAGNMGVATGMDVILDVARELQPADKYRFVLVGGGAERESLARRIESERLDNVTLLGALPREVAAAVMRDVDVCLVPLKRGIVDSLPTKLFDSLALGTPVIVSADGEAKTFVELSGGGLAVPPEDAQALADAIGALAGDPSRRQALGRNGQSYVWRNYDRARVVADIVRHIGSLTSP